MLVVRFHRHEWRDAVATCLLDADDVDILIVAIVGYLGHVERAISASAVDLDISIVDCQ